MKKPPLLRGLSVSVSPCLLGDDPAPAIDLTRNNYRLFFGDRFFLAKVTARIIDPTALKTLLVGAVFIAVAVEVADVTARTTLDLVHWILLLESIRTPTFYTQWETM